MLKRFSYRLFFLCRLRPGYIIQAIVYDNRVTNFNSIEHFFCFCVWGIHTSVGSVRQIDVPAVLGTPARIVDSDAPLNGSQNMTWLG